MDMTAFQIWTLGMRASAYVMVIFLLLLIWIQSPKKNVKYAFLFVSICLAGYLFLYIAPRSIFSLLYVLNLLLPTSLSLLVCSVFGDRLHRKIHFSAVAIIISLGVIYVMSDPPRQFLRVLAFVANLGLCLFAFRNAFLNFKDDLNETRKRLRLNVGLAGVSYVVVAALLSLVLPWEDSSRDMLLLVEGAVLLVAMLGLNLISINSAFRGPAFVIELNAPPHQSSDNTPAAQPADTVQSQDELKILQFMDSQKPYLEVRLTLESLAGAVGIPQHRVRNTLNRRLGHENFNDFVNRYRVEHAARLFATPGMENEKVFAIALQSGFSSLAPFNRAFKKRFGVPPSDYRSSIRTEAESVPR